MYTESNYFWGLVGYYLGALVVLWYVWWLLSKLAWHHVRNVLLLFCAALLLTPVQAYSDPNLQHLAPAFLVFLFEGLILGTEQDASRALIPMLFVFTLLLAGYGGWLWWCNKQAVSGQAESGNSDAEQV
ncbi:hypothetical protein ACVBEJ_01175 [Porticoccus sp. GXU_MW_L64]